MSKRQKTMHVRERRARAKCIIAELSAALPAECRLTILAGQRYREFIEPPLRERGFTIDVPLEHMRIGEQNQWLQRSNSQLSKTDLRQR